MKLTISQEMVNYVQRLGMEVDTRTFIIDRLFTNHKDDTDTSLFDSVPFKAYTDQLSKIKAEYDLAVKELGKKLIPIVEKETGVEGIQFDWKIEDFSDLEVEITIKDEGSSCSCGTCK